MTTAEDCVSRMEGAYEQVNQRLNDYVERFAEISQRLQTLQEEIRDLRREMNASDTALREEMNANNASIRRENRWIAGIIVAGIIVTVLSIIITRF